MAVDKRPHCRICLHPEAHLINADLASGMSYRKAADKWGINKSTVQYHVQKHMPDDVRALMKRAKELTQEVDAKNQIVDKKMENEIVSRVLNGVYMVEKTDEVVTNAETIRDRALQEDNYGAANQSNGVILKAVDTLTKLLAEAREQERMNEERMQREWIEVKKILIRVLDHHPEAKHEFEHELSTLGSDIFN
jgi:hypothetical protein